MKRVLGYDPLTGITEIFHKKAGKIVIESVQDVEPIIEMNKRNAEGLNKKEEWWYIGTTPAVLDVQWANESGTKLYSSEWQKYAQKKLNSAEYRKFNQNRIKL